MRCSFRLKVGHLVLTALAEVCRIYWYPIYSFVRRRGASPEDAQDLTQSFFLHLLAHNALSQVSPLKGKFRSFLLALLQNYLSDEADRARCLKRGGNIEFFPLDMRCAEDPRRSCGDSPRPSTQAAPRTTIAWLCDRIFIDAEQAKVCNLHGAQAFDQEAFLLTPATRMLLATRINPSAGHGRQLILTPPILFTQARIKHVQTDDLPQGRFGQPRGYAHLFGE